ncbi:hypothetical protein BRC96_09005 [Halobacteriales archaeon QS_6_64_34]|nr:MAG: hypothetical protein BRC96_09005 [Halobacteriales archaeon QS_6_64_34]
MRGSDSPPLDEQQLRLEDYRNQCQAIAVSTSERCQHDALSGIDYCAQHIEQADSLFAPGE